MNARSKTLALLVPCIAVVGALWLLLDGDNSRAVRAGAADGETSRPGDRAAELAGVEADPAGPVDSSEPTGGRAEVIAAPVQVAPAPAATTWEEGFDALAIYGTVTDDKALPVEGAVLRLWDPKPNTDYADWGLPLAECVSNAEGRFRFQGLSEFESYRVHVEAEGFLPAISTRETGVDEDFELKPSGAFAGRVLDAVTGAPLADIQVTVRHTAIGDEGFPIERVLSVTDAEGRYALPIARLDSMQTVGIRRPDGLREAREFQVTAEKPDGYDIELDPGSEVTLRIYELAGGAPLGDRDIEIASGIHVRTDAAGRARLTAPAVDRLRNGKLSLDLAIDGYCRTTRSVEVPAEGLAEPIEIPIYRGARVTGVVVDGDDQPVADARLYVNSKNRRLKGYDLPSGTSIRSNTGRVRSGEDGRFEITGVLSGESKVTVGARHDEHPSTTSDPFYLPNVGSEHEVKLELGPGATVAGTVHLNGEPVLARVWWRTPEKNGGGTCNDSGAYRVRGLPPGRVTLVASIDAGGWNSDEHTEEVQAEKGEVTLHDIHVMKNRATISGIVRDARGAPVASVNVQGWAQDEGRDQWHYANDETDAEGRFELAVDDKPGVTWSLWAEDGGRNDNVENVVVGATNVELVLPLTGKVALRVVDEVTREPVQRFHLYYRERDSGKSFRNLSQGGRELSPGPDGVFEAELPSGLLDLRFSARKQGYAPVELPSVMIAEGQTAPEELVALPRGVTVEFTFVKTSEQGQRPRLTLVTEEQRAELKASRWNDYAGREIYSAQRIQPDAEGKATLKGLPPGRYSLYRPPKNHVFEPEVFEIPPVDVHTVEVRWRYEKADKGSQSQGAELQVLEGLGYFSNG